TCQLPGVAMSRSYTATIYQVSPGAVVRVALSDAQFMQSPIGWPLNGLMGRVTGSVLSLTSWDSSFLYVWLGIAGKLRDNQHLTISGYAEATVMGPAFTAAFSGLVDLFGTAGYSGLIVGCRASDHQLVFTPAPASAAAGVGH